MIKRRIVSKISYCKSKYDVNFIRCILYTFHYIKNINNIKIYTNNI